MTQEILNLAKKLIKIPSTKNNPEALQQAIDFCENYFSQGSFVIKRFESNKKSSLVVTFKNTKSPEIFLVGHLDVVEAPDAMFEPRIEKNKLFARGASDMKTIDALMMVLMKKAARSRPYPDIGLMLTTDEEIGGFDGVRYLLNDQGYSCQCAVVPDGGDNFKLTLVEKGVFHFKIKTKGQSAHGSRPWLGTNAIDGLLEIYAHLRKKYPNPKSKDDWRISLSLGRIQGGDSTNKVADWAEMYLDLRYPETAKIKTIKQDIKEIVNQFPGASMETIVEGSVCSVSPDNPYIQTWGACARKVLAKEIEFDRSCGTSDARFFAEKNIPVIVTKPVCGGSHAEKEYIEIDSLRNYFDILWNFVYLRKP